MAVLEDLRRRWDDQHISNQDHASPQDVAAFEAKHGVVFPRAVADYFLQLNGTKHGRLGMEDEYQISFWHLSQVEPVEDEMGESAGGGLFFFADWMIDGTLWAVRLSKDASQSAPVTFWFGPSWQIAPAFEDFFAGYLRRDTSLLFPKERPCPAGGPLPA